jgi:hypothetical protein
VFEHCGVQIWVDLVLVDCAVSNQTGMMQIQTEIAEINFDETSESLPRTIASLVEHCRYSLQVVEEGYNFHTRCQIELYE